MKKKIGVGVTHPPQQAHNKQTFFSADAFPYSSLLLLSKAFYILQNLSAHKIRALQT